MDRNKKYAHDRLIPCMNRFKNEYYSCNIANMNGPNVGEVIVRDAIVLYIIEVVSCVVNQTHTYIYVQCMNVCCVIELNTKST